MPSFSCTFRALLSATLALALCVSCVGATGLATAVCCETALAAPGVEALYSTFTAESPTAAALSFITTTGAANVDNVLQGKADFAIISVLPTNQQYSSGKTLQLAPMFIIPVVVGYNLPSVAGSLVLSRELLVGIWAGNVTMWDDPALAALNPSVSLPAEPIRVLIRSGDAAATSIFTTALSKFSPWWASHFGVFSTPEGFVGSTGNLTQCKDDPIMASTILSTPYSMGYLSLNVAVGRAVTFAQVKNQHGVSTSPADAAIGRDLENVVFD
eukprot:RCo012767